MPRKLAEYEQVLSLAATANPDTGKLWRPVEIAKLLDLRPSSVRSILSSNDIRRTPPITPPRIDGLAQNERALLLGLRSGGMPAEIKPGTPGGRFLVVEQERHSDDDKRKAGSKNSIARRRLMMTQILPNYADVRDSDNKSIG